MGAFHGKEHSSFAIAQGEGPPPEVEVVAPEALERGFVEGGFQRGFRWPKGLLLARSCGLFEGCERGLSSIVKMLWLGRMPQTKGGGTTLIRPAIA